MGKFAVHDCRETVFFSTEGGRLCQWIEINVSCRLYPGNLRIEITTAGQIAATRLRAASGSANERVTLRAFAPARWPKTADPNARLIIRHKDRAYEARITVGSYRPWTIYLLSDLCADDTWDYADLKAHDRDDYLTTLAELAAGQDNRYNFATVDQVQRFFRQATPRRREALKRALQAGRFHMTPVPNQLYCGAFLLSTYPFLLDPFRKWSRHAGITEDNLPQDAYHMEAPSWSNGLVNLLACAGFRSFGKSLLQYQAPWIDRLRKLPRLTHLEVAPGRFVYLLLRCGDYTEGAALLAGPPQMNRYLHEQAIPQHEAWSGQYPITAIPLVGMYGDLSPESASLAAVKTDAVSRYNAQDWQYPRLVNATWGEFFDHVQRELGPADKPKAPKRLRVVRGDTGSSWEAWMLTAQAEAARFRKAQRAVASVQTLAAMQNAASAATARQLEEITLETVALGDHAWNGAFEASKRLNLKIRKQRLAKIEAHLTELRRGLARGVSFRAGQRLAAVNTLGWKRKCRVNLPQRLAGKDISLLDEKTGETFAVRGGPAGPYAIVADIAAFGARILQVTPGKAPGGARMFDAAELPIPLGKMEPLLQIDGKELRLAGRWDRTGCGKWRAGPFGIEATIIALDECPGVELQLAVRGKPPAKPYELRWLFELPQKRCVWRGESGGGFVTPGPPEKGGDSLLGIFGSIFSAGEGLSAAAAGGRSCTDFAFDESGMCGLGGPTTRLARGWYHEKVDAEIRRHSAMRSTTTPGKLEWYLLGNAQNFREALLDQGGARAWQFRCGIRRRKGRFDDAELYRFAAGFNRPAEVVLASAAILANKPWLQINNDRVLVLNACRQGRKIVLNLFNTSQKRQRVSLSGRATAGRKIAKADMLGRVLANCPRGKLTIEPKAFVQVVIR